MISKQTKIKLAKMLSLVSEIDTDKGLLVADNEIVVGEEVFMYDENGDLIPAVDGEFITDTLIYVVESGKITEIKEKEVTTTVLDETEDLKTQIEELNNQVADLNGQITERDEKIEALTKENEDLKAQIEEYKAKEGQSVEEPITDEEDKFSSKFDANKQNAINILKQKNR